MRVFSRLRRNFEHGVHPAHHKEQTEKLPIQRVPFGRHFIMPLGQHIGVPSRAVVAAGDPVERGQLIAEPGGFVSTALHSPVKGVISKVGDFRGVDGRFAPAIAIEADPFATQEVDPDAAPDWRSLSLEAFIEAVQMAGIVGMGGAAFPSHVKLSVPEGVKIRHLLINGAECEPYLTTDHRLMVERPEALLEGAEILRQKLGAEETVIGIEANKPEAIETISRHVSPDQPVRVLQPEDGLELVQRHAEIPQLVFRELPVELEHLGPLLLIQWRQYSRHGLPLDHGEPGARQARDATQHDHGEDGRTANQQPYSDGFVSVGTRHTGIPASAPIRVAATASWAR